MNTRMTLATGTLATLFAAPAFAQESAAPAASDSKLSAQAQVEVLPLGSGKTTLGDMSMSSDAAVAYGVSGMFDYAITPNISVGVAPRLVLHVLSADAAPEESASKQIDLRARLLAHFPVAPNLSLYAALTPGYTIITSTQDGIDDTKGFAIGGAAGVTYDVTPKLFIGGEVGYQRAFTSADLMLGDQKLTADSTLSYLHIGLGAGTRF